MCILVLMVAMQAAPAGVACIATEFGHMTDVINQSIKVQDVSSLFELMNSSSRTNKRELGVRQ